MFYIIIGQLIVITMILGYLGGRLSATQKQIGLLMEADISQMKTQDMILKISRNLMTNNTLQTEVHNRQMETQNLELKAQGLITEMLMKLTDGGTAQLNSQTQALYMLESLIKKDQK